MKISNKSKFISVLIGAAMCPMVLPTAAFAAGAGAASGVSSSPAELTQPEGTESAIAEVNGKGYPSLQAAFDAAPKYSTVKLLADTRENVTISTYKVTFDLNGHTLNGSTGKRKPALTINNGKVTIQDSSEAQTGTIMREDTAENSGTSSHYVIDVQGKDGFLLFNSGTVKNNSGAGGTKGASLVRIGDDSVKAWPTMTIAGGTFTQDNFIAIKVDCGTLYVKGGTINSKNSYAIENWKTATIKDNAVINGNVSSWTYEGRGSDLNISGGTVNGDVESVTYDGAEGKAAKVAITGGTVNGTLNTIDYRTGTTTDDSSKAAIKVTAGTFSSDPSRYLIEDSTATKNADGTYGVAKAYLAQVGGTSYYTMDEAFHAAVASGETLTLLRDYTTASSQNSGSKSFTIDLAGHTWTCTGTDANSAAFEINYPNASLTVKNGKIVSSQLIGLIPSANGGKITYNNSTLTFDGVEASTTATSGIETNGNNTNDTVVLKNSTLNVPNGYGIYFPSSGTLTIDNSTINAKTMGVQVCSGSLNVNPGSTITVSGDPVAKTENDGAIQDGAAISIVNRPGYKGLNKVAITGGTFTAQGSKNAAIKAYSWDSSTKQESPFDNADNKVTVSGGEFNGNLNLGNIEVSGGKYTDKEVAKHLKSGFAVLFSDGKYAVDNEKAVKGDATYSVTNTDGTVVYFTDAQSANSYAQESGAQAPKVLKVTVTFDSNQGTAVDSQLVAVGDKVVKPADPTKKGYSFSGWFTNKDCTRAYDFDAAVDDAKPEFTLYAGWKAEAQPGTGENGSNSGSGSNGGNSSANANANANTSHNKGKKPAKGGLPKTGDSLTLAGSACALVAAIAALIAASVLRRKKMN